MSAERISQLKDKPVLAYSLISSDPEEMSWYARKKLMSPVGQIERLLDPETVWPRLEVITRFSTSRLSAKSLLGSAENIVEAARLSVAGYTDAEVAREFGGVPKRSVEGARKILLTVMSRGLTESEKGKIGLPENNTPLDDMIGKRIEHYGPLFTILTRDMELITKAEEHTDFITFIDLISRGYSVRNTVDLFGVGNFFTPQQIYIVEDGLARVFIPDKAEGRVSSRFFTRLVLARFFAAESFTPRKKAVDLTKKLNASLARLISAKTEIRETNKALSRAKNFVKKFPEIERGIDNGATGIDPVLENPEIGIDEYLGVYADLQMLPMVATWILERKMKGHSSGDIARLIHTNEEIDIPVRTLTKYITNFTTFIINALLNGRVDYLSNEDFRKNMSRNRGDEIVELFGLLSRAKKKANAVE